MKKFEIRSVFSSLVLSVFIIFIMLLVWQYGQIYIDMLVDLVVPKDHVFTWWKLLILLALGVYVAYLAETRSIKKLLPYAAGFLTIWFVLSVLANTFFGVGLM